MALVTETVVIGGAEFAHHFSDNGHYILQTDTQLKYAEAYDPINNPLNHSYVEDEELIPEPEPDVDPETSAYEQAGRILLGVGDDE